MYVAAKRIIPGEESAADGDRLAAKSSGHAKPYGHESAASPSETAATIAPDSEAGIDRALLSRIAKGEQAAFRALMQRHLNVVVMTARRILRDEAEAEDLAQEAFLRLWHGAADLQVADYGLRPWLRRVTSNLAIDLLRKSRRLDVTDDVPEQADAPRQLRALEEDEASSRVERALASLPQRQRLAVGLFHFDELSQREVADAMQVTEEALESLLARGRRRLKELLTDEWRELLDNGQQDT